MSMKDEEILMKEKDRTMEHVFLDYVNRFRKYYSYIFQPVAQKYGLSQLEIDVLLFLYNNPEFTTARDIVEQRGFAKSNVSTAVESLRKKGYLTSNTDPENRKLRRLALMPDMEDRLREIASCQRQGLSALMTDFAEEEKGLMRQYFQRIDRNIVAAMADKK